MPAARQPSSTRPCAADPRLRDDHDIVEVRGNRHWQLGVLGTSGRADRTGRHSTTHGERVHTGLTAATVKRPAASLVNPWEVPLITPARLRALFAEARGLSLRVEHHTGHTKAPRAHYGDVDTHRIPPWRQLNPLRGRFDERRRMERGEERHQLLLGERRAHAGLLRARDRDAAAFDRHDIIPRVARP